MARYLGSKCKKCRRLGVSICGSPKCALRRRNYPPGIHGPKGIRRLSGYALQLREKQKAKAIYGILERQFKRFVQTALQKTGNTTLNLMRLLELRMDNIVYRSGFARTREQARQLVSHKHLQVNQKTVNIPSYQVRPGEILMIKPSKQKSKYYTEFLKQMEPQQTPAWLKVDKDQLKIEVIRLPEENDIMERIEMNPIIEFYSR